MPETRIRLLSSPLSAIPQLPDGVWLNLPDRPYFGQVGRMGSTDLSKLFLRKEGWWWQSWLNPHKDPEPTTTAKDYGKALHKAVLEGAAAFEAATYVMPTKDELRALHGDKFCVTTKDMVEALEARGMHPKANQSKDWFITFCRQRAPDLVVWEAAVAEAEAAAEGKILLSSGDRRDILMMADLVHNHEDVGPLFQFGPTNVPIPELTILWTDEHGLSRRARLDLLLPQNIIDLKSLFNVGNKKLAFSVGERVAEEAYHVQMADHLVARRWMLHFIQQGKVYDGTPEDLQTEDTAKRHAHEAEWLKLFPTDAVNSDYAWIFYQKPDAKAGSAPVVFPWGEDLGGDLHRRGIRCRREAIATYRRCMEQFGPDTPWTRVEPLHTTSERMPNRVFVPHWIGGDDQIPDEDDDL